MIRRVYLLFAPILIFIAIGCGKSDDNVYTVLATKDNYLIATWRAESEKAALLPARRLLESIPIGTKASTSIVVAKTELNPVDILLRNNQVGDWKIAGRISAYTPDNLFEFQLDETALYKAYNFVSLATAEYLNVKLGPKPYLRAEVYDMGASENAFGLYSTKTSPLAQYDLAQYDNVGNEAFMTEFTYDTWKGRYFAHIRAYEVAPDIQQGMMKIAKYIMSQIEDTGTPPDILNLLPKGNIVRGSVKFFKNHTAFNYIYPISKDRNILHLNEKTGGIIAEYISDKAKSISDTVNILLVKYPTAADAQEAYSSYKTYLLKEGYPKARNEVNGHENLERRSDLSEGKLGDKSVIIKTLTPKRVLRHMPSVPH